MIVHMQDDDKDVNAQFNDLNIRQPVLQVIIVLSFVSSFEKLHQGYPKNSKINL